MKARLLILAGLIVIVWIATRRESLIKQALREAAAQGVRIKMDNRRSEPTDAPSIYNGDYPPRRERAERLGDFDDLDAGWEGE